MSGLLKLLKNPEIDEFLDEEIAKVCILIEISLSKAIEFTKIFAI